MYEVVYFEDHILCVTALTLLTIDNRLDPQIIDIGYMTLMDDDWPQWTERVQ